MASPTLSDRQLAQKYGRRPEGVALFEPMEYGYRCPEGHCGAAIYWSEFKEHIWCYECKLDYPTETCLIQRPSWMSIKDFRDFLDKLPFKPKVLAGVDRSLEEKEPADS